MKTIIVGGGPVGLAAALALKERGITDDITVLEAASHEDEKFSDRNIALSLSSSRFLSRLGVVVDGANRALITTVEVSQRGAFGLLALHASDVGETMLGAAVPYPVLKRAFNNAITKASINVLYNATASAIEHAPSGVVVKLASGEQLRADCVALADGAGSEAGLMPEFKTFARDSGQMAVITRVRPALPRAGVAHERFTTGGALALIPRADGEWTVVWARANIEAKRLLDLDEESFSRELNNAFGSNLGELVLTSKRSSYPLAWRFVEPRVSGCVAALGNAAQGLHPVAAQGLNLGLRDAGAFADALMMQNGDNNVTSSLRTFARIRATDRVASIGFTGILAYAFDRGGWIADVPRGLALTAIGLVPALKRAMIARLAL